MVWRLPQVAHDRRQRHDEGSLVRYDLSGPLATSSLQSVDCIRQLYVKIGERTCVVGERFNHGVAPAEMEICMVVQLFANNGDCLLYTSDAADD